MLDAARCFESRDSIQHISLLGVDCEGQRVIRCGRTQCRLQKDKQHIYIHSYVGFAFHPIRVLNFNISVYS